MILANTEELHDQIEALLDRVKLLEDALRTLQASVSTQPHPLLSDVNHDILHLPVPSSFSTISTVSVRLDSHMDDEVPNEIDSHGDFTKF